MAGLEWEFNFDVFGLLEVWSISCRLSQLFLYFFYRGYLVSIKCFYFFDVEYRYVNSFDIYCLHKQLLYMGVLGIMLDTFDRCPWIPRQGLEDCFSFGVWNVVSYTHIRIGLTMRFITFLVFGQPNMKSHFFRFKLYFLTNYNYFVPF